MTELASYAKKFGLYFYDESILSMPLVKEGIHKISYQYAKEHKVLPVEEKGGVLTVAVSKVDAFDILEEVRFLTGCDVNEVICTEELIEKAIERCYRQSEGEAQDYINQVSRDSNEDVIDEHEYDLLGQNESSKVVKMLNMILLEALQQNASDIHFEPVENGLIVRYRIDGVLQQRHKTTKELQQQMITRIKVIAKLDIAEHRLPQDGRIKLKKGNKEIDFRVSTVPVVFGERIVLRILDKSKVSLNLDEMGMGDQLTTPFRRLIRQNQGIILVTGPTGSGKTTTLYSALADILSSEVNIMTIEDPVEYKLSQVAQIGVNPKIGLSFAKGLRHILRQDPDVVLIGEIRDRETADIAIQASLTGHLVLSTLHTNDAPSAITRLVDMGVEPYLISSAVLAVLGQRLVRVICPHCKEEYTPSDEECHELGVHDSKGPFYKGKGCDHCFGLGYQGRQAVYELLELNSELKQQLLANPESTHLQQLASEQGMVSMRQFGINRVLAGETTSAEVMRVTRGTV